MNNNRFETIVRDLEVDDTKRQHDLDCISPPDRLYVILFSARSGSTWLTSILSATKCLGTPAEFLNPGFMLDVAKAYNSKTPEHLLEVLKRRRQTKNRVFGMETRHFDVYLFGFKAFRAEFAKQALFFHLWRENVVAQAISLYRAHETNFYHSTSAGKKLEPPYNAEGVLRWLHHLVDTENGNVRLIQRLGVPARNLHYEEIVKSREKTVELFARALSVPFDPGAFGGPVEGELQKLADGWNEAAERRLRLENAVEVAALEAKRLVKIGVMPNPHRTPAKESPSSGLAGGHGCREGWLQPARQSVRSHRRQSQDMAQRLATGLG